MTSQFGGAVWSHISRKQRQKQQTNKNQKTLLLPFASSVHASLGALVEDHKDMSKADQAGEGRSASWLVWSMDLLSCPLTDSFPSFFLTSLHLEICDKLLVNVTKLFLLSPKIWSTQGWCYLYFCLPPSLPSSFSPSFYSFQKGNAMSTSLLICGKWQRCVFKNQEDTRWQLSVSGCGFDTIQQRKPGKSCISYINEH